MSVIHNIWWQELTWGRNNIRQHVCLQSVTAKEGVTGYIQQQRMQLTMQPGLLQRQTQQGQFERLEYAMVPPQSRGRIGSSVRVSSDRRYRGFLLAESREYNHCSEAKAIQLQFTYQIEGTESRYWFNPTAKQSSCSLHTRLRGLN